MRLRTDGWTNAMLITISPRSIGRGIKTDVWQEYKNSTEGVVAPAGAKVAGAIIRTRLLNKFI